MTKRKRDHSNDELIVDEPPKKRQRYSYQQHATEENSNCNNRQITTISSVSTISNNDSNNSNPNEDIPIFDQFPDYLVQLISHFSDVNYKNIRFIPTKTVLHDTSHINYGDVGQIQLNILDGDCPHSLGTFHTEYDSYYKRVDIKDNGFQEPNHFYHADQNKFVEQILILLMTFIFKHENGNYTVIRISSSFLKSHQIDPLSLPYRQYMINNEHYFLQPLAPNVLFNRYSNKYQYEATILIKKRDGFICDTGTNQNDTSIEFKRKCLIFQKRNISDDGEQIQIVFDFPITFLASGSWGDIPFKLKINNINITGQEFGFGTENDRDYRMGKYSSEINDPFYYIDSNTVLTYHYLKTRTAINNRNQYNYWWFEDQITNTFDIIDQRND